MIGHPLLVLTALLLSTPVFSLWPIPRTLQTGTTALRLSSSFHIDVKAGSIPGDLQQAVVQTVSYLQNDKLERLVVGRGKSDLQMVNQARELSTLALSLTGSEPVKSIADETVRDLTTRDESYTLTIPSDGSSATITANTTLGLFRGLTTFTQLWYSTGGVVYTLQAPVKITDTPAYPYRGFMLDTARNFFSVADIKRTINAMSWVKLNTFHWHAVDSQSFPIQIPGFHELSDAGAYKPESVYTEDDVRDIVTFAASRGVDIVLEIDTPGHTSVISKSHPDFVACPEATPWSNFAAEPPAGQLRLADPKVSNFTASLFSAATELFPSSLMSTGGDEVNTACYTNDATTQAQLKASGQNLTQALDSFVRATHGALSAAGKTPVVWEEMVTDWGLSLPKSTVVMVWTSSSQAATVASKGYRIVHAPSNYFYLDCGGGGWLNGGTSWCDPFKTWVQGYSFDPTSGLTKDQASLVLGGEHLLWTEQSGPSNLDSIAWPRAASSAEVFWTGAFQPDGSRRNSSSAFPRLHEVAYRFRQRGVNAIPLQPEWCVLRPGSC